MAESTGSINNKLFEMNDTIIAISSPLGYGAIGIIRISGDQSQSIISKYFRTNESKDQLLRERYVYVGKFVDNEDKFLDEICLVFYKSPNSYTSEDMVEIFTHGNPIIQEQIISAILKNDVRLAKEGEFTLRAFINGKMNLIKVESICDMIIAKSEEEIANANKIFNGELSSKIVELREKLIDLSSLHETAIEFDDEIQIEKVKLDDECKKIIELINPLTKTFENGKKVKNGLRVALCGKPNVGKSTLFNALIGADRSIVSKIPGTTRDYIDGEVLKNGKRFIIYDTAGVCTAKDEIENEGIKKTRQIISDCDVALFLIDSTREISNEDKIILDLLNNKTTIFLFSKCDLKIECDYRKISTEKPLMISSLTRMNLDSLWKQLEDNFISDINPNSLFLTSQRQFEALNKSLDHLSNYSRLINNNEPLDIAAIELRDAIKSIDELTGAVKNEEIINNIFSKFCIGK